MFQIVKRINVFVPVKRVENKLMIRLLDLPTSGDLASHLAKISIILETAGKLTRLVRISMQLTDVTTLIFCFCYYIFVFESRIVL